MLRSRRILYCLLLSVMCIDGLADDRNPACPLCGQNTVVEVVYGQPNREMAEKAAEGTIILGGCRVREEKIGCSFCHRYIRPYLERIRQHLLKYPGRDFNPEAIYSEQGDLKILKGWRCGDDLRAFVIRGRICKFGEQKVFRLRCIPLLIYCKGRYAQRIRISLRSNPKIV